MRATEDLVVATEAALDAVQLERDGRHRHPFENGLRAITRRLFGSRRHQT
ncbi:MAG: hypothetical protein LBJ83_01975 [Oscillospiraceae bacterium]|nr:hypothetical protein [Oscillospiraceae bacterium]